MVHAAVAMREPCERIRCCAEYAAQVASLDAQLDQLKAADVMARQQMQRCGCSPHPVGAHRERLRRLTHETSRTLLGSLAGCRKWRRHCQRRSTAWMPSVSAAVAPKPSCSRRGKQRRKCVPVLAAIGCNGWWARRRFVAFVVGGCGGCVAEGGCAADEARLHEPRWQSIHWYVSLGLCHGPIAMARSLIYEVHTKSFSKVQLSHAFGIRPRQALPRA